MHLPSILVAVVLALSRTIVAAPVDVDELVRQENAWRRQQLEQYNRPLGPKVMPRPDPRPQGRAMPYMMTKRDATRALEAGKRCEWQAKDCNRCCGGAGLNLGTVYLCVNYCNGVLQVPEAPASLSVEENRLAPN